MNKKELSEKMMKDSGITKIDALSMIDNMIDVISDELSGSGKVTLVGFGTFKTIQRKKKKGRNPRTGETIIIPAKKIVKFIPGKKLKQIVK